MRVLIVADLHASHTWWMWTWAAAPHYDAVIVAGDLVTQGKRHDRMRDDCEFAENTCAMIRQKTPVFISEGNHDETVNWPWMKAQLGRHRLGGLLIHTLPNVKAGEISEDLKMSRRLATEEGRTWIVVDHYPPTRSRTYGPDSPFNEKKETLDFGPDIVVSGHAHAAPFHPEGAWYDVVDRTLCLNPGTREGEDVPCHIILDTDVQIAVWMTPWHVDKVHYGPLLAR